MPEDKPSSGCGDSCGAGLEKVYPSTAVRYGAMRWIGEFNYKPGTVFKCGASVVIRTERGIELGEQVSLTCHGCSKSVSREQIRTYVENSGQEFYRLNSGTIMREATPQDSAEHARMNLNVREDIDRCSLLTAQLELDMKIITAEHLLGGERIVFYFRSEDRVDFRQLVRELARHYQTRIEMRQVGPRDEARLVADYEICGRECCCKNFLKKLRPVSMRMAKLQKSTLDPSKVSGRCGRLRCCLRYEHEGYEELDRKLPKLGARVRLAAGEATVVDRQILTQLLLLRGDDEREFAAPAEDVLEVLPGRPRGPAPAPGEAEESRGDDALLPPRRSDEEELPKGPNWRTRLEAEEPTPNAERPGDADDSDAAARDESATQPPSGPRRSRRRRRRRGGPASESNGGPNPAPEDGS